MPVSLPSSARARSLSESMSARAHSRVAWAISRLSGRTILRRFTMSVPCGARSGAVRRAGKIGVGLPRVALAAFDDRLLGAGLGNQRVNLGGGDANHLREVGGTGTGSGFDRGEQLDTALAAGGAFR